MTEHLEWQVGNGTLDLEHATIMELMDALGHGIASYQVDRLRVVAGRLVSELSAHFSDEEVLMKRYGYPQSIRHLQTHDAAKNWLMTLERELDLAQPSPPAMTAILESLSAILHREWKSEDPNLAKFLKAAMGAKPRRAEEFPACPT